jgi:HlyD family secretion protein
MKIDRLLSRRLALALVAVALLGAIVVVLMRSGPLAGTRVTVHEAQTGTVVPALFGIGTVEARRSYLIGPTAAGRVLRVAVDVGDRVKAGQLLAEMDPVDIDERVAALDASMARAVSAAAAADAQRKDALAKRELAAMNARRYVDLGDKNFISPSAVEAKLQERTSADAGVSAAEANLAAALQDGKRLAAERAGLRQQRDNVRLLAPADAVVTSRDAEPGSTVVAGQAVIKLIDPDSLWVKVRFDQGRSRGLATGLRAAIALRSNPAQPLAGTVARVEAVSDSVTEERLAQVAFERAPSGVSIGELAEVTVTLPATAAAVVVPNASLRQQADQIGVWLAEGGALRFAPLRLGQSSLDGWVEVLAGLRPGDPVVLYSEKELSTGSRIKVVDAIAGRQP